LLKRFIDILGSITLMIALSPVFLLIATLIKATDRGPVLFWQKRVGRWGREFPFPKFRSMVINAEQLKDQLLAQNDHGESVTFKMKKDPRITWIGRIIRRGSLDELPQLWCVLKGEMSLVGPRPPVPREVALYSLADRRRLDAMPGLTCIWQVSGRGDIPFPEQVALDVRYIESQSLWLDIKLLFQTIPAVLLGKGAY
jgi:lipopolysaccharide/colanic/teichoic acid biosynthesis glycosyltransferase